LRHLRGQGCEISRSIFTGADAGQVREANQALYMGCDAVVLFYGAGDQTWKYYQQTELKKLRGLRDKPPPVELTYVAGPSTADKELLLSLAEPNVVDASNGLPETAIASFIHTVAVAATKPPTHCLQQTFSRTEAVSRRREHPSSAESRSTPWSTLARSLSCHSRHVGIRNVTVNCGCDRRTPG
jgi:hypothetical protein